MVLFSIVVVNWNTKDLLRQCLESVDREIRALSPDQVEVFVVDNASHDGSVQMIRENFPWLHLIENQANVGFARANNQAIAASSGRYVLLLNSDTKVLPGALSDLAQFLGRHPDAGVVGAQLLNANGSLQTSCYPAPTLSRELWRLFHLDRFFAYGTYWMDDWSLNDPREVEVVQGACMAVRREVLEEVGLLDEAYFMYSEEVDWCYRIRQAGWRIFWLPQAKVIHYGGQSTQQAATAMFLCLYESKVFFFRKHYGSFSARVYKWILFATALMRLLVSPFVLLEGAERRRQHLALAGNYCRLIRSLPRL